MNISLLYFIGAGLCVLAAIAIEGFGPLVMNTTAEDKRGIHAMTFTALIVAGFLVYGGFDAAR